MTDRERLETMIREALNDGWQHEAPRLADALLAKGVTAPPAPAPPKPTWEPSEKAAAMLMEWWIADERDARNECRSLLRRLYAQLHRDRVAALTRPWPDRPDFVRWDAGGEDHVGLHRRYLLALADDGTGT